MLLTIKNKIFLDYIFKYFKIYIFFLKLKTFQIFILQNIKNSFLFFIIVFKK